MFQSQADMSGGYLEPGMGVRVRKNFKFERWESGWRCVAAEMSPVDQAWFLNKPAKREIDWGERSQGTVGPQGQPPCPGSYNAATWTSCFGTRTFQGGDTYVGEWMNGKMNGQGTYTFMMGWKFVGQFKDDQRHGQGIEYRYDGSVRLSGTWNQGKHLREPK